MPLDPMTESVLPVIEANKAELVTSDHELNDHIRLLPTPGHTPDHFAVCAGKGGDQAVFTGDLIHSPIQARYPELEAAGNIFCCAHALSLALGRACEALG